MAEVLPDLQKLKVINFGDCLVKSEGARAIAGAIKEGHQQLEVKFCKATFFPSPSNDIKTLQEINLSYDELDQDDALAVAEALENKKRLKKIELNGTLCSHKTIASYSVLSLAHVLCAQETVLVRKG